MKRILFILCLFFGMSGLAQQPENQFLQVDSLLYEQNFQQKYECDGRISFGFKASYNHSNLLGSERNYIFADNQTKWLSGFQAGIQVNTHCHQNFWLKHQLQLSMRGATVNLIDSVHGIYSSKLRTTYLDLLPISPTIHYHGFQVFAGPYLSLLADASIVRKQDGQDLIDKSIFGTSNNNESERKYLQKFDFGFLIGIEYQFPIGLSIGANYMRGFTDIFQFANSFTFGNSKTDKIRIHNHSIGISLGYQIQRKPK
ncbi:MAG: PorT family protein [Bacteroidia bacterium]|nr:PorT family protein [Bacteroidia bacterium]